MTDVRVFEGLYQIHRASSSPTYPFNTLIHIATEHTKNKTRNGILLQEQDLRE